MKLKEQKMNKRSTIKNSNDHQNPSGSSNEIGSKNTVNKVQSTNIC